MALLSIEAFLELVGRSEVAEPNRITAYLERLRAENGLPSEPGRLAGLMVRDGLLTQFQAEQILAGRYRGFHVGKYKVLERLGSGGMGTVYLAEHKFMRRRVALKVLPRSKASDPASLERFYREAKAVAALDHPNIVRAYDIDQDGDLHFLVMEFVDGANLHDLVKSKGPLDIPRAAHYITQAATGLQHAHLVGLVHRDIKPGNLLVDRSGTVKLLDMGLARFFNDEEESVTKKYDENVLGTADYLAPEQALDSHSVDIRADIYSLGGTLYYLLTGKSPFADGTVAQKLIWHQTRRPKPVRELRADIPDSVVAILDKMLAKSPDERYQTPEEVLEALKPWAQGTPPPPPEDVLPRHSPAVLSGAGGSQVTGSAATADGQDGSTALRKQAGTGVALQNAGAPASPSPTSPAVRPRAVAAKVAQQAPAGQAVAPALGPGDSRVPLSELAPGEALTIKPATSDANFPWQDMGSPGSSFKLDGGSKRLHSRQKSSRSSRSGPKWLWAAVIGGVVALGVAIGIIIWATRDPKPAETQPSSTTPKQVDATPQVWYVSKSGSTPNDVGSITAALRKAKSGDRIVVRSGEICEEKLDLRGVRKALVIEAEKDAVLRLPKDHHKKEPLIHIDGVDGLQIKGLTVDGQDRCEELVLVSGSCPGLTLESLKLMGFGLVGIRIDNCQGGKSERPVLLKGLRIEAPKLRAHAALLFTVPLPTAQNVNLRIEGCQFEGAFEAAVAIKAPMIAVTLHRNVFNGGKSSAIAFPTDAKDGSFLQMVVSNNTFHDYKAGLAFAKPPRFDSECELRNNLFYRISDVGVGNAGQLQGILIGKGNVYDQVKSRPGILAGLGKGTEKELELKAIPFDLPTSVEEADKFLRYPKTSPLAAAGVGDAPVGAFPPTEP